MPLSRIYPSRVCVSAKCAAVTGTEGLNPRALNAANALSTRRMDSGGDELEHPPIVRLEQRISPAAPPQLQPPRRNAPLSAL
jgi:hypothetical protein